MACITEFGSFRSWNLVRFSIPGTSNFEISHGFLLYFFLAAGCTAGLPGLLPPGFLPRRGLLPAREPDSFCILTVFSFFIPAFAVCPCADIAESCRNFFERLSLLKIFLNMDLIKMAIISLLLTLLL